MEAFIDKIIKALPDAIATAITTVILSGVLLFLFQKRIEDFFARSFLVYQTKFIRNHEKLVETFERLYNLFAQYKMLYREIFEGSFYLIRSGAFKVDVAKYEKLKLMLDDLGKYFLINRLFLPEYLSDEIESIWLRHHSLESLLELFLMDNPSKNAMSIANLRLQVLSLGTPVEDFEAKPYDERFMDLIVEMGNEIEKDYKKLEEFYRSVAEIKS